jgi:AraC-like DNA-binding protein
MESLRRRSRTRREGARPARPRRRAGPAAAAALQAAGPSVEEGLDLLAAREIDSAVDRFNRWAAALDARGPALSYILFDALCRIERAARHLRPEAAFTEERRLDLARRLGFCHDASECAAGFREALDEIVEALAAAPRPRPAVERARSYAAANFDRRISLEVVARQAGLSANYLSHVFKKDCGMTLTRFINELRVRRAVRLLEAGLSSVADVAYAVGYQNYRGFHRNFVRIQRAPPGRFIPRPAEPPGSAGPGGA